MRQLAKWLYVYNAIWTKLYEMCEMLNAEKISFYP